MLALGKILRTYQIDGPLATFMVTKRIIPNFLILDQERRSYVITIISKELYRPNLFHWSNLSEAEKLMGP